MLKAIPRSIFSWDFQISNEDGPVAVLDPAWLRERGNFVVDGVTYEIGRENIMGGEFSLRRDEETIATAVKPSMFFRSFDVKIGRTSYKLSAASSFMRRFELRKGSSVRGVIYPEKFFKRAAIIDLDDDIPIESQLFLTWLVIILWKRQQNSSS